MLSQVPIGVYTNLMERDQAGANFNSSAWEIEDRADRIALALLAPLEEVMAMADTTAAQFPERYSAITSLLRLRFGLPEAIALTYGRALLKSAGRGPSCRTRSSMASTMWRSPCGTWAMQSRPAPACMKRSP